MKSYEELVDLLRDMVDPGECWFDHHGGCQEHGYLSLRPGEICPHEEAKQVIKETDALAELKAELDEKGS